MITFNPAITINPSSITLADGTIITPNPITFTELNYSINYNNNRKLAIANITNAPIPIVLWKGADYDAAGQFSDFDVEARINAILGSDPASVLQGLYPKQT